MKKLFFIVAVLLAATSAHTSDTYLVKSELTHGSELLGSPSFAIEAGKPATIVVGGSYELTFLATPHEAGSVLISTNIVIAGEDNAPSLLVDLDQQASIRFGKTMLDLTVSRWATPE